MTCGQEFADAPDKCPFDGTLLSTISTELAPGTILGDRYEIIAAVAAGGMGQIYKAKHKLMNRVVAIKTIQMSLVSSGAALQRFQQEAEAISTLNHPNILTVFDFFISDDGQPYLVMDYLEGTNLQEVLKAEQILHLPRALSIVSAACSGFAHAHAHGVIHRDIKPANLMLVNFDGNPDFVKIVDFGIAKLVPQEGESRHLTATGDTFGSPEFMSPEQCRARKPDARSDIYSLGCVMYVALTGKSPFASQDAMEIMYKQVHDSPKAPSEVCPEANLPKELDKLVLKAMQKEPEQRFQSMDEMRVALNSIADQIGGTLDHSKLESSVRISVGAPSVESAGATTTDKMAVKTQSFAAFGAIGVAIVAVIVIVMALGNQKTAVVQKSTLQTSAPSPVVVNQKQTPTDAFQSNFTSGEVLFKAQKFSQARAAFVLAHSAAEDFGEQDSRYIDSLYLISKCDLSLGLYEQALQGLQYVLYEQKARYGNKSAQVRATEHDMQEAQSALKR